MSRRGFTFLELVITILCVGILAAVAVPQFISYAREAIRAAEQGSVQGIKAGIRIYGIDSVMKNRLPQFPATLDSAATTYASYANPLFNTVLSTPITEGNWLKIDSTMYRGPTETFYYYLPDTGSFLEYSGSTTVGGPSPSVFLPALAFSGYDPASWGEDNGGLYSPWSNRPLSMSVDFSQGGTYTFDIGAINNANHPAFADPPRTDWHLPTGYTTFNVRVLIDGVPLSSGNVSIAASDSQINHGTVSTYISAGQHTVSLVWLNDVWTPAENGDANIQFQNIVITRQ